MLSAATTDTIGAGFPTTTAAALTTLTTGVRPGRHGITGYQALDPERDRIVNLLHDWGESLDPAAWQRMPTLFEAAAAEGVVSAAIGPRRYRNSGFSAAILRGAAYLAGESIAERFHRARKVLGESDRSLSYVYIPELDAASHQHGWRSPRWTAALEEVDTAVAEFASTLRGGEGLLLTADHGVVDISHESHALVEPEFLSGVRHVGGEPRCLQLYLESGVDPDAVAARWRDREGGRAWIATRDEAIAADWFGPVDGEVRARIGDVLIAARKKVAYYLDPTDSGRGMIGQHGSLSADEVAIPLLRFGAFA
jgi:hypothetical protein